jgi:lipid-A-disaccharide synthase
MISAGEASGELYGAKLSRELKIKWPDVYIFGIGGPRMRAEGVSLIAPISDVLGIVEVFRHLFRIRQTYQKAKESLINIKPDILVLIDYPDFNIALAKKARADGIPILYYVSPQVWAWRSGRVKKIASIVNKMAVLFPFEVDFYKKTGLPCEFVGHPITESLDLSMTKEDMKKHLGLFPDRKVVALLPGSRPDEINRHSSIIISVAEKIHSEFPDIQVVVPMASGTALSETPPKFIKILYNATSKVVACAEAAVVASGTATLETALAGTPMVVFYKISPLTFFMGKILTNLKFIALVNILSGREVVRELVQKDATADKIYAELSKILQDIQYRNSIISDLNKIQNMMKGKSPSSRVAEITGEIAGWNDAVTV